ncbi:aryl-sulfate sulfotransferase [Flavobacterium sp. SM2513]|uniref:aryl-sulfate sulfotransferase n=1 Tax=Flavobacterium sp. SM2513 TaxID=3424766 RepID=UPI003D7FB582
MIKKILLYFCLLFSVIVFSQNTVGVIRNISQAYNGYTLFTSNTKTFLVNNCGQVVKQWGSTFNPGNSVYLLENGNLLRTGRTDSSDISFGGQGGVVELYNWDGNLIWQYFYDTPQNRQHHDIFPMPNGNVLILAANMMSNAEAIQAGRDPDSLPQDVLYSEQIVEVQPVGSDQGIVVWKWDMKDHFIQDFDSTKDNFGVVSENPNKLDINFIYQTGGNSNWLHINSVQYNAALDQILLSSRNLSEIYIIDHSTTTAEVLTDTGGLYGKGGNILWRWGNPQAYKKGTDGDRKLYGQHYPHWIADGLLDEGKLMVFNNGNDRQPAFSEVYILDVPSNAPGTYILESNGTFGPTAPDYIYSDTSETPSPFYSHILSGAERLPNGNILICEGIKGKIFEIDNQENVVWEYINPVHNATGVIATQGGNPPAANTLFRATKYSPDYAAFTGKDLTPGIPIELNSEINVACSVLSNNKFTAIEFTVSPNPTSGMVKISMDVEIDRVEVYTMLGAKISTALNSNKIDLSHLQSGIYFLKVFADGTLFTKKVIKR